MLQLEALKEHCSNRHYYLQAAIRHMHREEFVEMDHFVRLAEKEQRTIDRIETYFPGAFV